MIHNRWYPGTLSGIIAVSLLLFCVTTARAQSAPPREALESALGEISRSAHGSRAEAAAMEKAIIAARSLPATPAVSDRVIEHLGRAKTAARVASSPEDFLDAANAFGEAARLAPWVAEYHFNRGIVLEKAGRFEEAALSLKLYLKAAPNARDALEVRERIGGLSYLKEKAERAKTVSSANIAGSGKTSSLNGLYYNDGDYYEARTTTMMGHATITAIRITNGKITCGTFLPHNPNFSRREGFIPYKDGELGMANTSIALDSLMVTFCDNVRWCPTGAETGFRTSLSVGVAKDGKSMRVKASNCIAKPDYQVLNVHPLY